MRKLLLYSILGLHNFEWSYLRISLKEKINAADMLSWLVHGLSYLFLYAYPFESTEGLLFCQGQKFSEKGRERQKERGESNISIRSC